MPMPISSNQCCISVMPVKKVIFMVLVSPKLAIKCNAIHSDCNIFMELVPNIYGIFDLKKP